MFSQFSIKTTAVLALFLNTTHRETKTSFHQVPEVVDWKQKEKKKTTSTFLSGCQEVDLNIVTLVSSYIVLREPITTISNTFKDVKT